MRGFAWQQPLKWAAAFVIAVLGSSPALADFILPTTATYGWDRPTAPGGNATFQAWESFFNPSAGPHASQAVSGAGTGDPTQVTATFFQGFGGDSTKSWTTVNSGGSPTLTASAVGPPPPPPQVLLVTGSNNLYSPTGKVTAVINIPNNIDGVTGNQTEGLTTILLQTRNLGSGMDLSTVKLFDPISGTFISPTSSDLFVSEDDGQGGVRQDRLFEFNVAGNSDQYQLSFAALGPHMSLDRVAVDTFYDPSGSLAAVPEPASMVLTGLFLGGAWIGHRIRRRQSTSQEEPPA